jgi:hypothetical protein
VEYSAESPFQRRPHSSADPETQLRDDNYGLDGGSDDESDTDSDEDISSMGAESFDALEARFHGLEEEVANLVADVHDLALYTKLNITGFMKILKVSVSRSAHTSPSDGFVTQKHDVGSLPARCVSLYAESVDGRNKRICLLNLPLCKITWKNGRSTSTTGTL